MDFMDFNSLTLSDWLTIEEWRKTLTPAVTPGRVRQWLGKERITYRGRVAAILRGNVWFIHPKAERPEDLRHTRWTRQEQNAG